MGQELGWKCPAGLTRSDYVLETTLSAAFPPIRRVKWSHHVLQQIQVPEYACLFPILKALQHFFSPATPSPCPQFPRNRKWGTPPKQLLTYMRHYSLNQGFQVCNQLVCFLCEEGNLLLGEMRGELGQRERTRLWGKDPGALGCSGFLGYTAFSLPFHAYFYCKSRVLDSICQEFVGMDCLN